jgi:hypothetical protein
MTYAQITTNTVINTIALDDSTLISLFSQGYDYFLEIDNITDINGNQIGIGWYYDQNANTFSPPLLGYNYPVSVPTNVVYQTVIENNIAFGNSIISQMNADAAVAGIYQAGQAIAWLSYLQILYMCLQNGFLLDAINEFSTLIADTSTTKTNLSPFITNTNLTNYQTTVQNWVNQ